MNETMEIGIAALRKQFNGHAAVLLSGAYLQALPRARKAQQRFKVIKPLPSAEEYRRMMEKRYTSEIQGVVEDAFSELESLASELRDWYDNMPESFQNADKGQQVDEAANLLEGLSQPDVPECANEMAVYFVHGLDVKSRADRRDEACAGLQAALEAIDTAIADKKFKNVAGEWVPLDDEQVEELVSLRDEIDNLNAEAEGVEFPGMY